ncbi:MAG: DcaP family trimeric outer membrane transporter [Caulobacterales bacterium]
MRVGQGLKFALFVSAAAIVCAPGPVSAAPKAKGPSTAELAARVKSLEEALAALQSELAASRAQASQQAALAAPKQAAAEAKLIELEKKTDAVVAQAAATEKKLPSDGFKVGDATVKITGYVKAEALASELSAGPAAANALIHDFYLPGQIPVKGAAATSARETLDAHAKQTRLALSVARTVDAHKLAAYVEGDFQTTSSPATSVTGGGSERTTNGYTFAVRRAYVTFDEFLFGQDWTTFQNVAALPETTDFIGPTEGTVFVRQTQVRWSHPLSKTVMLQLAAENPESATSTTTAAALVENDQDRAPDFVARLNAKTGFGEFSIAALGRQLSIDTGTVRDEATGWGVSAAGKIPFGAKKRDDLRFMVTTGEGIGRYVGLNLAPDAIQVGAGPATRLDPVRLTAGFAAARIWWTDKTRSTFAYSIQSIDNDRAITPGLANKETWSAFANLFYSPVKNFDLGIELRHAERETQNGQTGKLDRVHLVAKQTF